MFPALEAFLAVNGRPLLFVLAAALLSYGYEIFNFNFSIDEEVQATGICACWLPMGRWGMYLINVLFIPYAAIPVVPISVALLCIAAAAVLALRMVEDSDGYPIYLFPALIVTFPTLAFNLSFAQNAAGVGIGTLTAVLAARLLTHSGLRAKLIGVGLLSFSLGIYQSTIFIMIGLVCIHQLVLLLEDHSYAPSQAVVALAGQAVAVLSSIALYGVIHRTIMFLTDASTSTYITGYLRWDAILHDPAGVLRHLFGNLQGAYFGRSEFYIGRLWLVPAALMLTVSGVAARLWRSNRRPLESAGILLLALLSLFTPFALSLLTDGKMPVRTLLSLPFVLALAMWVGFRYGSLNARRLSVIASVLLLVSYSSINNRHLNATALTLETDRHLAGNLVQRINQSLAKDGPASCIEVAGSWIHPKNEFVQKNNIFGASFFEWDQGNAIRIVPFLRTMGLPQNLRPCGMSIRRQLFEHGQSMSSWPLPQSVEIIDQAVIIKLGSYTERQIRRICDGSSMLACQADLTE